MTIADDPKAIATGAALTGVGGLTLYPAADEGLVVAAADVKISSALAEAIARRYLTQRYGQFEHLEFEAFTYEHGALVYMYHAEVPNLAAGYHVGPIQFVTRHAHVHVDALTGEVYGFGCGGGPGQVEMAFDPKAFPPDLNTKRLPYRQFETHFVVKEGQPPTVDGRIEPAEWADASHAVIEVGTTQAEVTEYGWGGQGESVALAPEKFRVEVWTKVHGETIYFGVRADTDRWIALLLKNFEHHGMIGDFNDAKLVSVQGAEDYFVASRPGQARPGPRLKAGVHTWMASGDLVRDPDNNLLAAAHRSVGTGREYEFAFPLRNAGAGNTDWQRGRAYQIAFLVGPTPRFAGVTETTWMSNQVVIRLGHASAPSIYHPPLAGPSKHP